MAGEKNHWQVKHSVSGQPPATRFPKFIVRSRQNQPLLKVPVNVLGIGGGQLMFNWPGDHLGWSLQMQTNLLAAGLGTNWVTVPGSSITNQIPMPINGGGGSAFFRLVYPRRPG